MPDSSAASRRAAASSVSSAGSQWPPNWNHCPALAWRVSSTSRASGETTSVLAVRWSGWQPRSIPSGRASRCATYRSRSAAWSSSGGGHARSDGERVGVEPVD